MTYALIAILLLGSGLGVGWFWTRYHEREKAAEQIRGWEGYADDLEGELRDMALQLEEANRVNAELHDKIDLVYDAGIYAGQTLQRDREANDL